MITYLAPAKVILSGEHSVVYGKPAITCAINLYLKFSLTDKKTPKIPRIEKIREMIQKELKINNKKSKTINYKVESKIPVGRGLGSSAALSSATAAAFYHYYSHNKPTSDIISTLAYRAEKLFNPKESGLDTTVTSAGGLIYFRREFDFLKSIFKLPYVIPDKIGKNLLLIDSGQPIESTGFIVNNIVGNRYNNNPEKFKEFFNQIESITKKLTISIITANNALFCQSVKSNQLLLEQIGIVSKKAKQLLTELSKYGVGKITGAGGVKQGSGYILFYSENKDRLKNYCKKNKINYLIFKQSDYGCKQNS